MIDPTALDDLVKALREGIKGADTTVRSMEALQKRYEKTHPLLSMMLGEQVGLIMREIHLTRVAEDTLEQVRTGQISGISGAVLCGVLSHALCETREEFKQNTQIMDQVWIHTLAQRPVVA
jgi:hypothetical protein